MDSPGDLLAAGNLTAAITAAEGAVKRAPGDLEARWLLAELLILIGETERADGQLDALISLEPRAAVAATPIRQLLRAEAARRQFFDEGRMPELLDGADEPVREQLRAFVQHRSGEAAAAAATVAAAEAARPALPGRLAGTTSGERAFTDFRDLDDLTAGVFEVLTQTGKYYWIPMGRVASISFSPPQRPLDLIWRKGQMCVPEAFEAEVCLPAVYGSLATADDASRLGRRTDFLGGEDEAAIGVGRRLFVVDGEDAIDMLDLERVEFVTS